MHCDVISQVLSVRGPVESDLALDHASANQIEFHVHICGALGYNGIVGESNGSGIVGLDGRLTLVRFHLYESLAQGYHVFGSDE